MQQRILESENGDVEDGNNSADEDNKFIQQRNARMQIKNYFGLPPYAIQSTSEALVYLGRKPLLVKKKVMEDDSVSESSLEEYDGEGRRIVRATSPNTHISGGTSRAGDSDLHGSKSDDNNRDGDGDYSNSSSLDKKKDAAKPVGEGGAAVDQSQVAQKAVVRALYTMANNQGMRHHYIFKGGIDAVNRLINEATDEYVLNICAKCIDTVLSSDRSICKPLVQEKS